MGEWEKSRNWSFICSFLQLPLLRQDPPGVSRPRDSHELASETKQFLSLTLTEVRPDLKKPSCLLSSQKLPRLKCPREATLRTSTAASRTCPLPPDFSSCTQGMSQLLPCVRLDSKTVAEVVFNFPSLVPITLDQGSHEILTRVSILTMINCSPKAEYDAFMLTKTHPR